MELKKSSVTHSPGRSEECALSRGRVSKVGWLEMQSPRPSPTLGDSQAPSSRPPHSGEEEAEGTGAETHTE